jgi:tetratricopeptide (TPR) repeat protein
MSEGEADVRGLLARGEVLLAYDRATALLADHPDAPALRYLAALALARAGARDRARAELDELAARGGVPAGDTRLAEDVAALRARLVKDEALGQSGEARRATAAKASSSYESAYQRFGGYFACINAATMAVVAGDKKRALSLARQAHELVGDSTAEEGGGEEAYWRMATKAEAALILGDLEAATEALREAATLSEANLALRATTRRQLAFLGAELGAPPDLLSSLSVPVVLHYTGHRFRDAGSREDDLRAEIRATLERLGGDIAYGALAYGGDIVVAEEIQARGGELHVILPCPRDEFVASSVRPGGDSWVQRFRRCFERADSVECEPSAARPEDPSMYAFGSRLAMGAAVIRAQTLTTKPAQLAIWDGRPSEGEAGTAADVECWKGSGRRTEIVSWDRPRAPALAPRTPAGPTRELRAMAFSDFKGFSRLDESQVVVFFDKVMGAVSAAIDSFGEAVLARNSWGDGLYLVFTAVQDAARCGLALQQTIADLNFASLGLPSDMGLRIGLHAGPVFPTVDPVTKQPSFFGTHVTRTARVEPRTPPGEVYMTGSAAALLALEPLPDITPEYVGQLQLAKDYDVRPMYVLRHWAAPSPDW